MSPYRHRVALAQSQNHVINSTNLSRALDDGIKHRLHIRGRAARDTEHLGCCSLMLQGFAQFLGGRRLVLRCVGELPVAYFEFLAQLGYRLSLFGQ